MLPRIHKTKLLITSGVGDTFFSPTSHKKFLYGHEIGDKIVKHIKKHVNDYYGVINVTSPKETWDVIQPFNPVKKSRLVNFVLTSNKFLDISNEICIKNQQKENMLFNGNEFDFLFPAQDYEIHITGVDLHGVFTDMITSLLERGYTVFLYSDMIKRYKDAEPFFRSIRNPNFHYDYSKKALA